MQQAIASHALASASVHPYDNTWLTVSATAFPSRQQRHFSWRLNRVSPPQKPYQKLVNLDHFPQGSVSKSKILETIHLDGSRVLYLLILKANHSQLKVSLKSYHPRRPESLHRHPGGQFVVNTIQGCHYVIINLSRSLRCENPKRITVIFGSRTRAAHLSWKFNRSDQTGRWGLGTKKFIEHFFL